MPNGSLESPGRGKWESNKEEEGRRVSSRQASRSEARSNQVDRSEASSSQAGRSEASSSQAGRSEVSSSQAGRSEASSSHVGRSEASSSEASSSEASSSKASSSEASSSKASCSKASCSKASSSKASCSKASSGKATKVDGDADKDTENGVPIARTSGEALGKRKSIGPPGDDAQGREYGANAHGQLMTDVIQDIVPLVRQLVAIARKTKGCELELRFGRIRKDKFEPGISRGKMDESINRLQSNISMKSDDWNEFVDFYYPVERGGDKLLARTRVRYNTNHFVTQKSHCFKTKLKNIVIAVPQHDIAFKIELSQEETFQTFDMPQIANPTFVRIQQRRCFLHGGVENDENWRYDFSMTWSGNTKTKAEILQSKQEPTFEFEIELNGKEYFEKHDDEHVAQSVLMKGLDFVGYRSKLQLVSNNL